MTAHRRRRNANGADEIVDAKSYSSTAKSNDCTSEGGNGGGFSMT